MYGMDSGHGSQGRKGKVISVERRGSLSLPSQCCFTLFLMLPLMILFLLHVVSTHPHSISQFYSGRLFFLLKMLFPNKLIFTCAISAICVSQSQMKVRFSTSPYQNIGKCMAIKMVIKMARMMKSVVVVFFFELMKQAKFSQLNHETKIVKTRTQLFEGMSYLIYYNIFFFLVF